MSTKFSVNHLGEACPGNVWLGYLAIPRFTMDVKQEINRCMKNIIFKHIFLQNSMDKLDKLSNLVALALGPFKFVGN